MSALWSGVTDLIGDRAPSRPRLRPVQRRQRRMARLPFVIVLIAIFAVGMTGLLMLNTALQSQAFQARQLDTEAARLGYSQAALQQQVDTLRSPQSLASRATGLGMRANPSPAFLILPSGKIIGEANPVRGDEEPSLIVKTTAQIKAEEAAAAARKAEAERAKAEAAAKKAAEAKKKADAKKAAEAKQAADAKKKAEQEQKKKATDGGTGAR